MPILVKDAQVGHDDGVGTVTQWLCAEGDDVAPVTRCLLPRRTRLPRCEAPREGVASADRGRRRLRGQGRRCVAVLTEPGETLTDDEVDEFLAAQAPPAARASSPSAVGARQDRRPLPPPATRSGRVRASPAARKLARELDVDLRRSPRPVPAGVSPARMSSAPRLPATDASVREDWARLNDGRRVFYCSPGPMGHRRWSSSMVSAARHPRGRRYSRRSPRRTRSSHSIFPDMVRATPAIRRSSITRSLASHRSYAKSCDAGFVVDHALGHSLGGAVAATAALEDPDLVTRLVLVDSAGIGDSINPRAHRTSDWRTRARQLLASCSSCSFMMSGLFWSRGSMSTFLPGVGPARTSQFAQSRVVHSDQRPSHDNSPRAVSAAGFGYLGR